MPSNEHYEHRMRRAKSWHEQSKIAKSDEERFIFLWIAFNAAYGGEPGNNSDENEIKKLRNSWEKSYTTTNRKKKR